MESITSFLKYVFRYRANVVDKVMFYVSVICIFTVITHVGYITSPEVALNTEKSIVIMFYGLFLLDLIRTGSSIYASRRINVSQYSGIAVVAGLFFIVLARVTDAGDRKSVV